VKRALLIVAVLAQAAHANVWKDAVAIGSPDAASKETYEKELREGDEQVLLANSGSTAMSERRRKVQLAITKYRAAAAAMPKQAEPYFRIAATLNSFYLDSCVDQPGNGFTRSPFKDCSQHDAIDLGIAQQVIDALDEAEKRAPMDPRFSGNDGESMLFERAILNTKLGADDKRAPKTLAKAAKDYERYLERNDGKGANVETTWSNLAETYMMLGRLDDAIEAYREISTPTSTSTIYGAAVALDRNDRTQLAHQLIIGQGRTGYQAFRKSVDEEKTFFVPAGEKFYYFALAEEALGDISSSIGHWRDFIQSGAHPKFQPRAKQHLDDLLKKRGKVTPNPDLFPEE